MPLKTFFKKTLKASPGMTLVDASQSQYNTLTFFHIVHSVPSFTVSPMRLCFEKGLC